MNSFLSHHRRASENSSKDVLTKKTTARQSALCLYLDYVTVERLFSWLFFFFFYQCFLLINISAGEYVPVYVCTRLWRPEVPVGSLPQSLSVLFSETVRLSL